MKFAREHDDRAWLAYHIAVLSRVRKLKPKVFRDLLSNQSEARKPQTADQMFAIWSAMAAASKKGRHH